MKVAIVVSIFYEDLAESLVGGSLEAFREAKIPEKSVDIFQVPGSFEIPAFIQNLADEKTYDGFIALGAVIKGETDHYTIVCNAVAYGIQKVAIKNRVPVMFGVLTCATKAQAIARAGKDLGNNKGYGCAKGLIKLLTA